MTPDTQRFRLPKALGGGEYDGIANGAHVILDIPNVGAMPFPADVVTLVVPAEPVDGAWVAVAPVDRELPPYAFCRRDDLALSLDRPWWWHENQEWLSWPEVYAKGVPRRVGLPGQIAATPSSRVVCPVCDVSVPVRKDGRIFNHPMKGPRCEGSNCPAPKGGA